MYITILSQINETKLVVDKIVSGVYFIHMSQQSSNKKNYVYKLMKSPIGELKLVGSDQGLAAILWEDDNPKRVPLDITAEDATLPILIETEKQLREYFVGNRKTFDLKLNFNGTDFQKKVWKALLNIPFGETTSYGAIAQQLGNPKAVRAVGAANGRNPISIIAACHRVISSSGKLTGYAGGFVAKAHLLKLEGRQLDGDPQKHTIVQIGKVSRLNLEK